MTTPAATRTFEMIDALYTVFTDAFEADLTLTVPVTVWDGPLPNGANPLDFVTIGFDPDPETLGAAAASDQSWAGIGQNARYETITVPCSAVAIRNDSTAWKPVRDAAKAILEVISTALRADPSLGMDHVNTAEIASTSTKEVGAARGMWVAVNFTVQLKSRI